MHKLGVISDYTVAVFGCLVLLLRESDTWVCLHLNK